jgi:hypothetical protein
VFLPAFHAFRRGYNQKEPTCFKIYSEKLSTWQVIQIATYKFLIFYFNASFVILEILEHLGLWGDKTHQNVLRLIRSTKEARSLMTTVAAV